MAEIINEEIILTQEGYDKIVAEYEDLKSVKRGEIAERIKEAISYGDISENAEYDSAKNEQAELEERILYLEDMIRRAKVVQKEDVKGDAVGIGLTVEVVDKNTGEEEEFIIVGATESDPFEGKITTESAVGKALIGRRVGEEVQVEVPDGIITYTIKKISKGGSDSGE